MMLNTLVSLALLPGILTGAHPAPVAAPSALPQLSAHGLEFQTSDGHPFQLRGVNLGGWLVEEMWMTPWVTDPPAGSNFTKVGDHTSLWKTISDRLGGDAMVQVRTAWRDNWIRPIDFAKIKGAGLNHVRLPFLSSLLDEPGGMAWLHKAVNEAKAAGLYTVLDMHGLPGGQSNEHHTGTMNKNRLWFDVENITEAEQDWKRVANEFKDEPAVAAFDLINEPMGAPNPAMLNLVYDRLYRAIRSVNTKTVILIEDGYKGFDTTPHPNLAQWNNVAYSLHFYDFNAKANEDHVTGLQHDLPKIKELLGYRQTPMYVGEWNVEPFGGPTVIGPYITELNKAGFSWAFWTWKVAAKASLGTWGIVRPSAPPVLLNPFEDSAEVLIQKIQGLRTDKMEIPEDALAALKGS